MLSAGDCWCGNDNARRAFLILRWDPRQPDAVTRALPWEDIGDREGWRTEKRRCQCDNQTIVAGRSGRLAAANW